MSVPLINRSLTTIRTELEFLHDSEVITEGLYNKILEALPQKYQKDSPPVGVEKLGVQNGLPLYSADSVPDKLAQELSQAYISKPIVAHVRAPSPRPSNQPLGYCKVIYDYDSQEGDDLPLVKGDKIAIIEHLSEDWWKGYKHNNPEKVGVFPTNYVTSISEQDFSLARSAPPPPQLQNQDSQGLYQNQDLYQRQQQQQYQPQQQQQQQLGYGGYAQYPPQSTNYYQPQQQQQQQQAPPQQQQPEQPHKDSALKKIGGKFGNAAIFGAGATLGGDLINSIF